VESLLKYDCKRGADESNLIKELWLLNCFLYRRVLGCAYSAQITEIVHERHALPAQAELDDMIAFAGAKQNVTGADADGMGGPSADNRAVFVLV
jgi:hypothetical protein